MIVTESDAAKKWCRHVRHGFITPSLAATVSGWACAIVGINRASKLGDAANCIGSQCMAWRWAEKTGPCRRGYCGDAGEPKHA